MNSRQVALTKSQGSYRPIRSLQVIIFYISQSINYPLAMDIRYFFGVVPYLFLKAEIKWLAVL